MKLTRDGKQLFPLGMYDMPRNDDEWRIWHDSGIMLMPCGSRERLDDAAEHGMMGWARMPMIVTNSADEQTLRERVEAVRDHEALAIWQGPDEPIHFASKVPLKTGHPVKEPWLLSDDNRAALKSQLDTVVDGMIRGAEIVRELDPTRSIWLNDTAGTYRDALAGVASAFDMLGFDMYPVRDPVGDPMNLFGRIIDEYARCAPRAEMWPVQQAFSWHLINESVNPAYPNPRELRFIAWQSLVHRATALHWWGVRHVEQHDPFLDLVTDCIAEIHGLNDMLLGTELPGIEVNTHYLRNPAIMGVSRVARKADDGTTLLALVNEDGYRHNAVVRGLESAGIDNPNDLRPVYSEGDDQFHQIDGGWVIGIDGYSVRVFTTA